MATAFVTFGPPVLPGILDGASSRTAVVTTSGTAATTSLTANMGDVAVVNCATAVYARQAGTAAAAAVSVYCPGGVPTAIGVAEGYAVSLIDA